MAAPKPTQSLSALAEKRTGRTTNHSEILAWIADSGTGLTVTEIGEAMCVSPSTLRPYLRDLVEAGWLGQGYSFGGGRTYFATHGDGSEED